MRSRTKRWHPGCVLRAKPRRDGVNFTNHRKRPHVVLSDWTCVPLTAGNCKHIHLLPTDTNGLTKPSELITTFRAIPVRGYNYLVIGKLSIDELILADRLSYEFPANTFIELRS